MPPIRVIAIASSLAMGFALASSTAMAKDQGPVSGDCDQLEKTTAAWMECASKAPASAGPAVTDAQAFYAGYWLARNGRYQEALSFLRKAKVRNSRVLTYIGFATRKLGRVDEAMDYYAQALKRDPNNYIARSYLGEAHLTRNDLGAALAQLDLVEKGCGRDCDAYRELAEKIQAYRS